LIIAKKYFFLRIAVFIYQDIVFDLVVFTYENAKIVKIKNNELFVLGYFFFVTRIYT